MKPKPRPLQKPSVAERRLSQTDGRTGSPPPSPTRSSHARRDGEFRPRALTSSYTCFFFHHQSISYPRSLRWFGFDGGFFSAPILGSFAWRLGLDWTIRWTLSLTHFTSHHATYSKMTECLPGLHPSNERLGSRRPFRPSSAYSFCSP